VSRELQMLQPGDRDARRETALATLEIQDALARNARGVDRLDRDVLLSSYHPGARDNHGSFDGPAEQLAEWIIRRHAGAILCCSHFLAPPLLRIEGDRATAETYNTVFYRTEGPKGPADMVAFGRYADEIERRDGAWRIASRTVVFEHDRIDPLVGRWSDREPGPVVFGRRDARDPSFGVLPDMSTCRSVGDPVDKMMARMEIRDALQRFCRGADRRDRELLLSAFQPDAQIAYAASPTSPAALADRLVDPAGAAINSVHFLANDLTHVDGDRAVSETYVIIVQRHAECGGLADARIVGRFVSRLEHRQGEWRIIELTLVVDQDRIDPVGQQWDDPMKPLLVKGARSSADFSYEVLGRLAP
jgi:hypothetical protein